MHKILFVVLFFIFLLSEHTNNIPSLPIDPSPEDAFQGVNIEGFIFLNPFNTTSRCPRNEIGEEYTLTATSSFVGLGFFSKGNGAIIFFKYDGSSKAFLSKKVYSAEEELSCECFERIRGEILIFLKQQSNEKGLKKALFPLFNSLLSLFYKPFALL